MMAIDIGLENVRAQMDMQVTLDEAHKAHPEIPINLLGNLKEVREYANEIMRDMQSFTGKRHEIRWAGIVEQDGSVSWVVSINPVGQR